MDRVAAFDILGLLSQGGGMETPTDDDSTPALPRLNPLPHLRHLSLSRVHLKIPQDWSLGYPSTIEELRLSVIFVPENILPRLLRGLCGPHLHALHVLSWFSHAAYDGSPTGLPSDVLKHVSSLSSNIRSITMGRTILQIPSLQEFVALFPKVECVRLCRANESITASLKIESLAPLETVSSDGPHSQTTLVRPQAPMHGGRFMTHLHVDGVRLMKNNPKFMHSFSTFLLSEAAAHLGELVAPKVEYTTTFIEVDDIQRYMWTCRNLKVLVISFGTETQADRSDWYPARTMLAFIVVNCPRLIHLEISRHIFNMSIRCGFCFLSRLKHLERLVITTSQFSSWGGHQGSVKLARWMRVQPTLKDILFGQSSLALCRRIAKLDKGDGYFGLPEGRRMLWPSKTSRTGASGKDPNASPAPSERACWSMLRSIHIDITGTMTDDMRDKANQEAALMHKAFPHIEYTICPNTKKRGI